MKAMKDVSHKNETVEETILNLATKNRETYGGNLETSKYYMSFLADMREDLSKEFGGPWHCIVGSKTGRNWAMIYVPNGFGFEIEDNDAYLLCWIRNQC